MTQSLAVRPYGRQAAARSRRTGWSRPGPAQARRLTTLITFLALLAAVAVALVPPASYLLAQHAHEAGALEARSRALASELARYGWLLNAPGGEPSLRRILRSSVHGHPLELQRLLQPGGALVLASEPEAAPAAPLLRRRAVIGAEGAILGEIEVVHSLRPMLRSAGLLLIASAALGVLIFLLLRLLPLRMLRQALDRASYLSSHDALTGLTNRAAFQERLQQAVQAARRDRQTVAVLLLDLNGFKRVNDVFGHAAGDALLLAVAQRLSGSLRAGDTLARLGGDEFAAIQTGTPQPQEAAASLATRMLALLASPFELGGGEVEVGASIGIALSRPGENDDPAGLVRQADLAMYQAKQEGAAGFHLFTPELNRRLLERRALEQDLRRAVAERQFRLAYQPLVCLASGRILGAEALLRWHRPGHGDVPPDRFIGVAEEIGLIGPIGAWVLQEACREAASWSAPLEIAVNVSPLQFRHAGLPETVEAALRSAGLAPERLELEITEGALLHDTQEILGALQRLRSLGVRIAMDDFGTGYSSLGYLNRFAFDKIKIDRSFVQHMAQDPHAKAVIRAVMGISRTLGIRANAEGVESDEQAELLRQEGCKEVQGYLYGHPMPPQQFAALCGAAG